MSRTSCSLGLFGLTVTFTFFPLALAAQDTTARHDSSACPPGVMTDWELMASGVIPGVAAHIMSGEMMGPGMLDYGLPMSMPDGGLMMDVMRFQPDRVLALQQQLRLSLEQIDDMERLIAARWDAERSMRISMEAAVKQLQAAVEADVPDTAAVRRQALRLAALRDALYAEVVVSGAASRRILNEQQREEIRNGPCALHNVTSPNKRESGRQ